MGAAVGDFDNDMDLDWFVSSIWAAAETTAFQRVGITGNRLYRNDGGGNFDDATEQSGVRNGSWGWGACFMDFNNDGYLDIFHVNGFGLEPFEAPEFFNDRSRLFVSNGDGTFSEVAIELELIDTGEGRGIVCFDYDKDGDIDIFIANNGQSPSLFRNDGGNNNNFINIKLGGISPNTEGIGARVYIEVKGGKQMREIQAGSNFVSQNPAVAHFGISDAEIIDNIQV